MTIPFVIRSQFLAACQEAIVGQPPRAVGESVSVRLPQGGYQGQVEVTIRPEPEAGFDNDWEGTDPTRFPVRIRAAATALRDARCFGRFRISHQDGNLTIQRLGD